MKFTVARYKDKIGYLCVMNHAHDRVGFKTNGGYFRLYYSDLESGRFLLPIPFYKGREARIITHHVNSSFTISIIGARRAVDKRNKLRVPLGEMSWYMVDSTNWVQNNRDNVKTKYGLYNLDFEEYERII